MLVKQLTFLTKMLLSLSQYQLHTEDTGPEPNLLQSSKNKMF